jgi:hypothetical protein
MLSLRSLAVARVGEPAREERTVIEQHGKREESKT